MARTDNLTHYLSDIATAIRNKTGESGIIKASEFDTKIKNINTGTNINGNIQEYYVNQQENIQAGDFVNLVEGVEGLEPIKYLTANTDTSAYNQSVIMNDGRIVIFTEHFSTSSTDYVTVCRFDEHNLVNMTVSEFTNSGYDYAFTGVWSDTIVYSACFYNSSKMLYVRFYEIHDDDTATLVGTASTGNNDIFSHKDSYYTGRTYVQCSQNRWIVTARWIGGSYDAVSIGQCDISYDATNGAQFTIVSTPQIMYKSNQDMGSPVINSYNDKIIVASKYENGTTWCKIYNGLSTITETNYLANFTIDSTSNDTLRNVVWIDESHFFVLYTVSSNTKFMLYTFDASTNSVTYVNSAYTDSTDIYSCKVIDKYDHYIVMLGNGNSGTWLVKYDMDLHGVVAYEPQKYLIAREDVSRNYHTYGPQYVYGLPIKMSTSNFSRAYYDGTLDTIPSLYHKTYETQAALANTATVNGVAKTSGAGGDEYGHKDKIQVYIPYTNE